MIEGLKFGNIEEIKLTRVGENTFSISIKSDIAKDSNILNDGIFEADLCTIDSAIELKCEREFKNCDTGWYGGIFDTYSIPMNIKLLVDKNLNMFTIKENMTNT